MPRRPERDNHMEELRNKIEQKINTSKNGVWLKDHLDELTKLINFYTIPKNQEKFLPISEKATDSEKALREALRKDPLMILDTLLMSSVLGDLQKQYDESIAQLAAANGVEYRNTAQAVTDLQKATIAKMKPEIDAHYAKDPANKTAVGMTGMGGIGKGTVIENAGLSAVVNDVGLPRVARPSESDGKPYHFHSWFNTETPVEEIEAKLGKLLARLVRPGRGVYLTTVAAVKEALMNSRVATIEQSPENILEIDKNAKDLMPELKVVPVCILPPGSGILPIAIRLAARTFGDPGHGKVVDGVYQIDDSYYVSTMGKDQLKETLSTTMFNGKTGIAYIVNDDLDTAVRIFKDLVCPQ